METKKIKEEINKTKGWLFENINKINKSLARLTKKKRKPQKSELKEKFTNRYWRNTKDHKRLL